ncbi:acyltransferase [Actinophytocola sp.]|uniref:acyltransferase family protein n=1 Tax=Actinophytocola sp. TaxID=1872138 RepID=UPI002D6FD2D1|nr:acyltransferase [Actinophytocola sp.]HYQ68700.1 acyltransferase [Actinophytocola sp.]
MTDTKPDTKPVNTPAAAATGGTNPGGHLRSLTSLRFLAAFLVFGTHAGLESLFSDQGVGTAVNEFFGPGGRYGVSFFFVLSGFVLTWTARPGQTARRFWRARAAKIYPVHLVTALVAAVLLVTVAKAALDPTVVATNLLLLHGWVPRVDIMVSLNTPSWSLSCEAFFYLLFPVLLFAARRIRPSLLWLAALASMAVVAVTPLLSEILVPTEPRLPGYGVSLEQTWFLKWFPPSHLFEFVTGILVARIIMSGKWIRFGFAPAVVLAAVGYALITMLPFSYTFGAVTVLPTALLIGAAAHADITGASTWGLRARVPVWLGQISFAFYMVHWLVLSFGHRWVGPGPWGVPGALGLIAAGLAVSIVLSWALHAAVERPFVRAFGRSKRAAPHLESEANWSHKNCE